MGTLIHKRQPVGQTVKTNTSLARFRMVFFGFLALLVVLSPSLLYGQLDRANLNGTVTDTSGAIVPNAHVEVVSPSTGFKREAETGEAGVYSITGLPVGTYDLTIFHQGFRTFQQKGITLLVGQTRTLDAQLQVGAALERVEVQAAAQPLETGNAELGGVVESRQVSDIPINGRDWAVLMALAPGGVNLGGGGQRDMRFVGRGSTTATTPSMAWMRPASRSRARR
jgi:hypothetical protein